MSGIRETLICAVIFFFSMAAASYSLALEAAPLTMPSMVPGANPSVPPEQQKTIPVEKVSSGALRIGDVQIDEETRSITFPACVNMDKGLLEYLLVHSSGKTHESLLRTTVKPYDLQLAFLLLGFKGTDHPISYQGAPEKPKGEPVEITITYDNKADQTTTLRPEQWIVKAEGNSRKDIGTVDWVFTGSMIMEGDFMAQREGSIIAIFHDPAAVVDNTSTGGESDKIWFPKEGEVPPVGTSVALTIKALK